MITSRHQESAPDFLRLLVVDPDPDPVTRKSIQNTLLTRKEFHLVGEYSSGLEAIPVLREPGVDVLLCETELPGVPGLSLLDMVPAPQRPLVIFMNRSDRYAAGAFEASAIDYLLKPFSTERLDNALERAVQHARAAVARLHPGASPASSPGRLSIRTGRSVLFLNTSELDWAEAEGKYVRLHLGRESMVLRLSITALEAELDPSRFIRIHRCTLVNVDRVRWVQPWMNGRTYQIVLHDGTRLVLSRKDHLRTLTQRAVLSV